MGLFDTIKSSLGIASADAHIQPGIQPNEKLDFGVGTRTPQAPWSGQGHVPYKDTRPGATEKANYTTDIPVKLLKDVVTGSLARGISPEKTLAQLIGESTAAKYGDPNNPLNVGEWALPSNPANKGQYHKEVSSPVAPKNNLEAALNYIHHLETKRYKGDPAKALQAYQGLGMLRKGVDTWDGPTTNAGKAMPYYHKVKAIKRTFNPRDNQQLVDMIEDVKRNYYNPRQGGATRTY